MAYRGDRERKLVGVKGRVELSHETRLSCLRPCYLGPPLVILGTNNMTTAVSKIPLLIIVKRRQFTSTLVTL